MPTLHRPTRALLLLTATLAAVTTAHAQAPVRLQESFRPGYEYHVSTRVDLTGNLTLPPEKGAAAAKTLTVTGKSAIEYDERVLTQDKDGRVGKTVRIYRRVDFQRHVGDQPQQSTIRPEVRRLVLLRLQQKEVPFSPDGPLTWAEIDLVRTDVFTPALTGLLPPGPVRPGDRWQASTDAVQELTDLEKIEEGGVACKFDQVTVLGGRRHARIGFSGSVRGPGEDGPSRHQLEGSFFFDLESNHISYVSVNGVQQLLDKDGKAAGKVEGNFVLTRQPHRQARELSDEGLRGLALEPNEDNTLLLYDNPDLGVKLLHPRRWRIAGVRGRQVGLDENRGSGLLLTMEPPKQVPAAAAFLQEARTYMTQQKGTILGQDPPQTIQGAPRTVERFALDVKVNNERVLLAYFVIRQANGGATLVARLLRDDRAALVRDVERIARSVEVTRTPGP